QYRYVHGASSLFFGMGEMSGSDGEMPGSDGETSGSTARFQGSGDELSAATSFRRRPPRMGGNDGGTPLGRPRARAGTSGASSRPFQSHRPMPQQRSDPLSPPAPAWRPPGALARHSDRA